MRIALFVTEFPELTDTFVLDHIVGLVQRGHHVDIFAQPPREQGVMHPDVERYELLRHTFHRPRFEPNRIVRLLRAAGLGISKGWRNPGLIARSLNVTRYGKEAASLNLFQAALPLIKPRSYDVIHAHFGPNGLLAMRLREIGALSGKIVTAFHGVDMTKFVRIHGDNVYQPLFDAGDVMLPISNFWKRRLMALGCPEDRIRIHHMGVDCTQFDSHPRTLGDGETANIVSIGRFIEKKGMEYGVQAVAALLKRGRRITYNIVGDGPGRSAIEKIIAEAGCGEHIRLLGWRTKDDIAKILSNSHILLAPSVTAADGDQEGIPVVLMEALSMGIPVVSTLHTGIPELVEEGVHGYLVPERDVPALAKKLGALIDEADRWPEMGRSGRAKVEREFNNERLNDDLVELYASLVQPETTPSPGPSACV